jgi:branched-chain amino acid aminotransferase
MSVKVWVNGALTSEVAPDFDGLGFSLSEGLTETIRAVGGRALHLNRHWRRLRMGTAVLELHMPYGDGALSSAVRELLAEEGGGDAMVRLTLTRGPTPRGFLPPREGTPSVLIAKAPLPPAPPPADLVVSAVTRRNEYSPLARIKTLSTLDSLLARQEAIRRGADDAVMLNSRGRIAGASAANLFFLFGDEIVTPPVAEGAMPGIRRELALECFPITESPLSVDEAAGADDILLTTSISLRAAASLEGRPLPRSGVLREWFAQAL